MIYGSHRTKGAPALGALPGQVGPFGHRPEPDADADADEEPTVLRTQSLPCPYCAAGPARGQARTLASAGDHLTVTWHLPTCPHYAADRLLTDEED
ncbi:hypothetical protein [Streptomyces sp. NPDC051577]|uniref:hypothetical protein n=1 Tax=Streptomyces sp. NPDC051577 TaxID=3155166 RepID=UPI00343700E4